MTLHIITGPPCAGKTTHVLANATPGALIIDLDTIAHALTTPDTPSHHYPDHIGQLARQLRNQAINPALELHAQGHEIWIIDSSPTPSRTNDYRASGATVTHLDADLNTLLTRASTRPDHYPQLIRDYKNQPTNHTRQW